MTGRTCDCQLDHLTEIVERHEVSVVVGPAKLLEPVEAAILTQCREAALRWQEAHGMSVPLSTFQRYAEHADGPAVGVSWEVVVGKAAGPADGPEQWRWSARFNHWLDVFAGLRQGGRGRTPTLAAVPEVED